MCIFCEKAKSELDGNLTAAQKREIESCVDPLMHISYCLLGELFVMRKSMMAKLWHPVGILHAEKASCDGPGLAREAHPRHDPHWVPWGGQDHLPEFCFEEPPGEELRKFFVS